MGAGHRVIMVLTVVAVGATAGAQNDLPRGDTVVPVLVTNFPEAVTVDGAVALKGPLAQTDLKSVTDILIPPVERRDTNHLVDAGAVVTSGFAGAVVTLVGEVKGEVKQRGGVGAVLVPEEDRVLRALREQGALLLPMEVRVPSVGSSPYFASDSARFTVAFPSYRLFLYNESDTTVSASVHIYLTP